MRTLSRISFLLMSAALCGGTAASAQAAETQTAPPAATGQMHRHHGPDAEHQVKMLTKKLGLTPDQAEQVKPILAERDQKMAALRADTTVTGKQMHQQQRAIAMDSKQKLDAILNDAQKKQFEDMMAERRHHGRGGEQNTAAPAPTA